jgi:hypothetical protein
MSTHSVIMKFTIINCCCKWCVDKGCGQADINGLGLNEGHGLSFFKQMF